jgi:hypothetical protein
LVAVADRGSAQSAEFVTKVIGGAQTNWSINAKVTDYNLYLMLYPSSFSSSAGLL